MMPIAAATQPFPKSGTLVRNMNLSLKLLQTILQGQHGPLYGYIVDTVRFTGGRFEQTGSGPNFQGDLITLSTCKHQMRSGLTESDWCGSWVAGFTGVDTVPDHHINYLVYLMKVADAYPSHRDLWNNLPDATRLAKAADLDRLGDLYRPRPSADAAFDPESYEPPRPDHSHCNTNWREDIDYLSPTYGRRPPLLVGELQYSFLWSTPLIAYPAQVHARTKKHELRDLLTHLTNRPIRDRTEPRA